MKERELREIAEEYLVPLISGSRIDAAKSTSSPSDDTVAWNSPVCIEFKVDSDDNYRLRLTRGQPFARIGTSVVPEIVVVRAFVEVLATMQGPLKSEFRRDVLATFERRVVAKAIAPDAETFVLEGIDNLASWATKLYEGSPISAAIGFRKTKPNEQHSIPMSGVMAAEFSAVLSNGHDTLLEFNFNGQLIGHAVALGNSVVPSYCPYRQAPIAEWTTKHEKRVAIALNRLGEILVFRNEQLLFARRSGKWAFLTHDPIITQMGTPHDKSVRLAIWETCLDASFARTGACIGVVSATNTSRWKKVAVETADYLDSPTSDKAKALSKIVADRKFQHLDRRLRQELTAIDGSIIIANNGTILAIGAILKLPGGSSGGGRLAAAKALAKLGLGIKVSQDGAILGFRLDESNPKFHIM